jgi:hypothetical protein
MVDVFYCRDAVARPSSKHMPRKPRKYSKTKEMKAIARERIGTPPPVRTLAVKVDQKKPKHKKKEIEE